MKEFRRQLNELGKQRDRSYLLTAAVPAGLWLVQNYELKALSPLLDWFNLMTYDFSGAWSKRPISPHRYIGLRTTLSLPTT
jgi:chitinase